MAKRRSKTNPFFKYLAFSMTVVTMITLVLFKIIDLLPNDYFYVLCIFLGLITLAFSLLVTRSNTKKRAIGTILSILYLILLICVIIYELNTIEFFKKFGFKNYRTENYLIVVLKDSEYNTLNDLNNKTISSLEFNTEGLQKAKSKIDKKINVEYQEYDDISKLKKDFKNKKIEGFLLESSLLAIISEDDESFTKLYRIIDTISIDVGIENIKNEVDVTKDSFNVFISGIDTYGSVSSVSRSDVNMVLSINPKTHHILVTSIPRDYYVDLAGKNAKDKLTHAGIYGVETSVKSVETLLDIKINYYLKVNFSSLTKLVDALDGVNVYSKYAFTSRDGYTYQKGNNEVNGAKALSFVRERKAFYEGDRARIENQAAMVKAIIDKAISPNIITKYNKILDALEDSFITNLDQESITSFIKKQIDDMPSWEIQNISLNGKDSLEYTYSYKGTKLYVMIPNKETIINAHQKIEENNK